MDVTGLADPYVKIYLLYNQQRIAKKKTHVKKRTLSPVFNESFVFDIPNGADGLNNVSLEFMLLDWDRVTKNEVSWTLSLLDREKREDDSSYRADNVSRDISRILILMDNEKCDSRSSRWSAG